MDAPRSSPTDPAPPLIFGRLRFDIVPGEGIRVGILVRSGKRRGRKTLGPDDALRLLAWLHEICGIAPVGSSLLAPCGDKHPRGVECGACDELAMDPHGSAPR